MMPADQHQLRTLIALAIAKVPPETKLACADKRPKVDWTGWDAARMEMAGLIAAEIAQGMDIRSKDWRRHASSTSRPLAEAEGPAA